MKTCSTSFGLLLLFLLLVRIPAPGQDSLVNWQHSLLTAQDPGLRLIKPLKSGDLQNEVSGRKLSDPIRVLVVDAMEQPVEGVRVSFRILKQPKDAEGFTLLEEEAFTDSTGLAQSSLRLGNKPGTYEITARIKASTERDLLVFSFTARKANWLLMLVFGLLGGLGLFLLGMETMSEGMKQSAGERLRSILGNLTRNRLLALGLGTFVTMVIQSSSAVSVMLVGFVNSRLMKFRRTIAIILGANIGTTITAQLIAFKVTDYALLMIALGFALVYFSRKQGLKYLGQAILGFGVLFFGMHVMSDAMYPLQSYAPLRSLMLELENPLTGIIVGALFTALLQSSSAFIGILIVMAGQGLLSLEAGIALLLGSNIGTSITAILASIRTSREARKVGLANVLVNLVGVTVFVTWIPTFAVLVESISAESIPRQLANAHTIFNASMALMLLPVTGLMARLIDRIFPEKAQGPILNFQTSFLNDRLLGAPVLGLNLAKEEAMRVAGLCQDILGDTLLPFISKEALLVDEIREKGRQVSFLSGEINLYLVRITRQALDPERVNESFQIMYSVKEMEQLSSACTSLVGKSAGQWIAGPVEFSDEGKRELLEYHLKVQKQLSRAIEVFRDVNLEKALRMKAKHKAYRGLAAELEKSHYERLRDNEKELEAKGDTHLEIMSYLRGMMSHATNIARILLQWENRPEN